MNILLVGEESAGIRVLRLLAESCHRVVGVVASPKPRYGSPVTLWDTARKLGYRTWDAERVKDPSFAHQIRAEGVDLLLNIHSLHVITGEVLQAPQIGCFNLHPGPLPRYAGLNPVCWALYFGERTHGVTLHGMTAEIDAGPIIYQTIFPICEADTGFSVSLRCIQEGLPLVARLLATLEEGPEKLPRVSQNRTERHYYGRGVPHGGHVPWSLDAQKVVNFVRACNFSPFSSPWGLPQASKGGQVFGIITATRTGSLASAAPGTVGCQDSFGIRVACGDEWISLGKIKVRNKLTNATELLHAGDYLEEDRDDSASGIREVLL
jgi:methionyl-tRNA formyltransferase